VNLPMPERLRRDALESAVREALASGLDRDPRQLLRWAYDLLGPRLMMTTALQKGGMVILHMVKDWLPELPVFFIDTRFHFSETLEFLQEVERRWGLRVKLQRPTMAFDAFKAAHGETLFETNPDLCCHINKVEPMAALTERYQGWVTAVRRDQSTTRAQADPLEILESNQLKVQPLVHWTRAMVEAYVREHAVLLHPLYERGYTSIGCAPCTVPSGAGGGERDGRWAGKAKTECGLHLFKKRVDRKPPGTAPPPSA
jgi:phosphoadenosine phosphosulfate reductase